MRGLKERSYLSLCEFIRNRMIFRDSLSASPLKERLIDTFSLDTGGTLAGLLYCKTSTSQPQNCLYPKADTFKGVQSKTARDLGLNYSIYKTTLNLFNSYSLISLFLVYMHDDIIKGSDSQKISILYLLTIKPHQIKVFWIILAIQEATRTMSHL